MTAPEPQRDVLAATTNDRLSQLASVLVDAVEASELAQNIPYEVRNAVGIAAANPQSNLQELFRNIAIEKGSQ